MMARSSQQHICMRGAMKDRILACLLVAALAVSTAGWSGEARSQTNVKRVGILSFFELADAPEWQSYLDAFRGALAGQGWVEGQNVAFEFRGANSDPSKLGATAEALVTQKVDVIWAVSAPALRAAHLATRTIPIVAIDYTADPVAEGYVENYGRPGGNVTGVFLDAPEFAGKWFELLRAMIPDLSRVAVLWDPAPGATHMKAARNIAKALNIRTQVLEVRTPEDIDKAFVAMGEPPQALIVLPSPMIYAESPHLARLALKNHTLAISFARAFANAGGAIAYGPDDIAAVVGLAELVAKVLGGAKPAVIPVQRPTKIQLIVNLKTAKTLGITVPDSVLLRADEVIR